jgi:hypothetical protein
MDFVPENNVAESPNVSYPANVLIQWDFGAAHRGTQDE